MLFEHEQQIVKDEEAALVFLREIELPVCLNLGLCYIKIQEYQLAIKYCTQAIERDDENDKAFYRRGLAYMHKG